MTSKKTFFLFVAFILSIYFLFQKSPSFPDLPHGIYLTDFKSKNEGISLVLIRNQRGFSGEIRLGKKNTFLNNNRIFYKDKIGSALIVEYNKNNTFELSVTSGTQDKWFGNVRNLVSGSQYELNLKKVRVITEKENNLSDILLLHNLRKDYLKKEKEFNSLQKKEARLQQEILNLKGLFSGANDLKKIATERIQTAEQELTKRQLDKEALYGLLVGLVEGIHKLQRITVNGQFASLSKLILALEAREHNHSSSSKFNNDSFTELMTDYLQDGRVSEIRNLQAEIAREKDLIYIYEYRLKQNVP